MENSMHLTIVVAVGDNGVIGSAERPIPWNVPADVLRYKSLVRKRPVIVGRKTFELVKEPLSEIEDIVLSRNPNFCPPRGRVALSIESALDLVDEYDSAFVVGGAEIYGQFMPMANRMYVTEVHASPPGDTFFRYAADEWMEIERMPNRADELNEFDYSYVTLIREKAFRLQDPYRHRGVDQP